jgi:hypothetical protein
MLTFDFFTQRRPLCSRGRVGSPNGVATIGTVTGWFFASPPMELLSTEGCELTVGTIPNCDRLGFGVRFINASFEALSFRYDGVMIGRFGQQYL